jgi:type I restriction enzyme S subunit
LIVRTGVPGISCVVPAEYDGSNCIDIIFARPNPAIMTSEFLSRFMNTSTAKRQAFKARTGIAQQHLNVGAVQRIEVPIPPLKEQKEIVNVLRACDDKVDALEQELALLDELFRALLEKLMTGRLSTLPLVEEAGSHE